MDDITEKWNEKLPILYEAIRRYIEGFEDITDEEFNENKNTRLEAAITLDTLARLRNKPKYEQWAMAVALGPQEETNSEFLIRIGMAYSLYQEHRISERFYQTLGFTKEEINNAIVKVMKKYKTKIH